MAVLPQECMGQLAPFGPTLHLSRAGERGDLHDRPPRPRGARDRAAARPAGPATGGGAIFSFFTPPPVLIYISLTKYAGEREGDFAARG